MRLEQSSLYFWSFFYKENMKTIRLTEILFVFTLFIFGQISLFGQAAQPQPVELAKYIQANFTKREVLIPMRDGVKLFTSMSEG